MSHLSWAGVSCLSLSWLFLVPVFAVPNLGLGLSAMALGALLMGLDTKGKSPGRAGFDLMLQLGGILALQVTATALFFHFGARWHHLSWLAALLGMALDVLGFQPISNEGMIYVEGLERLIPHAVTWEKLGLLPAMWLGLGALSLIATGHPQQILRQLAKLVPLLVGFICLRYLALIILGHWLEVQNQAAPLWAVHTVIFQKPWIQAASWLPLIWFLCVLIPLKPAATSIESAGKTHRRMPLIWTTALFTAGFSICGFFQYQDPGHPKSGRILIDEYHSHRWASATKELNTHQFGRETVYTYTTMVRLLRQYFQVSLNKGQPLTSQTLANTDVLILKTPTLAYAQSEIEAVTRFVKNGGGLFLIGDHTNLLGTSTHLNQIASQFGLGFNLDAVNRLQDGYFHQYTTPKFFSHPAASGLEQLQFMTSCTLKAPLFSENVMIGVNTFSDPLDYGAPSFFGNVQPDPEDSFGLHLLASAQKFGKGRVLAFSDSTLFSSFAVLYPERPEFLLQTLAYLNRENSWGTLPNWGLLTFGGLLLLYMPLAFLKNGAMPPCRWWLGTGALSLTAGVLIAGLFWGWHGNLDLPRKRPQHAAPEIGFIAQHSHFFLPAPLVDTVEEPVLQSFDTFYVWTQRLGFLPRVRPLDTALQQANTLVFINPINRLSTRKLKAVEAFVRAGGKLLILDSILNRHSIANQLLEPFSMAMGVDNQPVHNRFALSEKSASESGPPKTGQAAPTAPPSTPILLFEDVGAAPIRQPVLTPILTLSGDATAIFQNADGQTLAALKKHGQGRVLAMCNATMFSRAYMGTATDNPPYSDNREALFKLEFSLFENYLFGKTTLSEDPATPPFERQTARPAAAP